MDLKEYKGKFYNARYWQRNANRHFYSSQVLYKNLEPFMNKEEMESDEENEQFISLWQSYFLLIGLAFENILKGLIISINPDLGNEKDYKNNYGFSFNHNLIQMFDKNFRVLTPVENDLISRLQEYLIWMSKYPVPKLSNIPDETTKRINFNDNESLITLYNEVESCLITNVESDPIRHWNATI